VADYPYGAPGIVRKLLLSASVVCDPAEAEQAIAWGRAHPAGRMTRRRCTRSTRT
jgi:hypothetical protein